MKVKLILLRELLRILNFVLVVIVVIIKLIDGLMFCLK